MYYMEFLSTLVQEQLLQVVPKEEVSQRAPKYEVVGLRANMQQVAAVQAPSHCTVLAAASAGAVQLPVKSAQVSPGWTTQPKPVQAGEDRRTKNSISRGPLTRLPE